MIPGHPQDGHLGSDILSLEAALYGGLMPVRSEEAFHSLFRPRCL